MIELIAAFFNDCNDAVRFDLKPYFGFGVDALLLLGDDMIKPSSGSSSSSGAGTSGWFKAHSSVVGRDLAFSFLKFDVDLRLRNDSGVVKLPLDNIDLSSSSSNDGTDSTDVVLIYRPSSSDILSPGRTHFSSLSSASSKRTLKAGLLL